MNTEKKAIKKAPVPYLILIDIILTCISLGIFMIFFYVIPVKYDSSNKIISTIDEDDTISTFSSDSNDTSSDDQSNNVNDSSISDNNITTTIINDYTNEDTSISITKKEYGVGNDKVTYYVADIKISNVNDFCSAFADNTYGKNIKATVEDISSNTNAIIAINGDFYGNTEDGLIIRNGILYRNEEILTDVCVLFTDGTMKTYLKEDFDASEVIDQGAWPVWCFGPALLDSVGEIPASYNTSSYISEDHPRTTLGYIEPGHYIMVVVDGRNTGYSKGVTLTELSQLIINEGCNVAYNLDGGKSSAMTFNGEYVNEPASGGREISDILYISN